MDGAPEASDGCRMRWPQLLASLRTMVSVAADTHHRNASSARLLNIARSCMPYRSSDVIAVPAATTAITHPCRTGPAVPRFASGGTSIGVPPMTNIGEPRDWHFKSPHSGINRMCSTWSSVSVLVAVDVDQAVARPLLFVRIGSALRHILPPSSH